MTCWVLATRKARRGERSQMADACAAAGCKDPIVWTRQPGNLATWQALTGATSILLATRSKLGEPGKLATASLLGDPRWRSASLKSSSCCALCVTMLKKTSLAFLTDQQAVQFSAKVPNRQLANLDMADSSSTCWPNNVRSSRHTLKAWLLNLSIYDSERQQILLLICKFCPILWRRKAFEIFKREGLTSTPTLGSPLQVYLPQY